MEHAPPGFRFKPTRRELIRWYLEPWVADPGKTPVGELQGIVCVADVYGADPATLTSRHRRFGHDDGNWYFLCVTRWKGGSGSAGGRMSRAVLGGGTWHGYGKRIPVAGSGYRQTFEYRDARGSKTAWLMEEFGTGQPAATDDAGVKVLCRCRVHRTPRPAADDEEHQETNKARSSKRRRQERDFAADTKDEPEPLEMLTMDEPAPLEHVFAKDEPEPLETLTKNLPEPLEILTMYGPEPLEILTMNVPEPLEILTKDEPLPLEMLTKNLPLPLEMLTKNLPLPLETLTKNLPEPLETLTKDVPEPLETLTKVEPQPLEMLTKNLPDPLETLTAADMEEWQQFSQMDYGFRFTSEEDARLNNEWMHRTFFSCPEPPIWPPPQADKLLGNWHPLI